MPRKKKDEDSIGTGVFSRPVEQLVAQSIPRSEEAEMGTLGSILADQGKCIAEVTTRITVEYFYNTIHQGLYLEMLAMWEKGEKIDLITFTQNLRDKGELDSLGGAAYVTSLFTFVPTSANLNSYLDILHDKFILRQIVTTGTEFVARAVQEQANVPELLNKLQSSFAGIKKFDIHKTKTLSEHIEDKIDRMEKGEADDDIIKTRLNDLDKISPLRKGDMPIIMGEAKDGKTIFALTILENICIGQKLPGVIFTLESPASETVDRIFAGVSRIPMEFHHVKKLSDEQMRISAEASSKISRANIIIRDDLYDLHSIVSACRKYVLEYPDLAVIVVDYAQLVRGVIKKSGTRESEVASVSRELRLFAMESKVPVILISQLNEQGRTRESKALEQDGTAFWKIIRDEFEPNKRTIYVERQRNGQSGVSAELSFLGNIARYENISKKTSP